MQRDVSGTNGAMVVSDVVGYLHIVRRVRTDGKAVAGLGLGGIVSGLCSAAEVRE